MKINLVVVFFLFLYSLNGYSQMSLGFMGGINKTSIKADNYDELPQATQDRFNWKTGIRAGIFSSIKLNRFFSLRPELAYSEKGAVMTVDSFNTVFDVPPGWTDAYRVRSEIMLRYIEVPVLLRFSSQLFNILSEKEGRHSFPASVDLMAGPTIAYLFDEKKYNQTSHRRASTNDTTWRYNFIHRYNDYNDFPENSIRRWDVGAVLAIALRVKVSAKTALFAEARHSLSFTNLNKRYWDRALKYGSSLVKTIQPAIINTGIFTGSVGIITTINFKNIQPEKLQ